MGVFTEQELQPAGLAGFAPRAPNPAKPGLGETIGSAFTQNNTVGSAIGAFRDTFAMTEAARSNPVDFDPLADLPEDYQPYASSFIEAIKPGQVEIIKRRVDDEIRAREVLARAGAPGVVASIGAGILDPVNLIPVGGWAAKGAKGASVLGRIGEGALVGGLSASAAEGVLMATQEDRSYQEAATNIGAGVVLGGALGGALGLFNASPMAGKVSERFASEWDAARSGGSSVGAAQRITGDDARPASALGLEKLEAKNPVSDNPLLRSLTSTNPEVARVAAELAETPYYLQGNDRGVASPLAAETRIKQWQGPLAQGLGEMDDAFARYRFSRDRKLFDQTRAGVQDLTGQAAGKLSYSQFKQEVGKAMRRGDAHDIPEVAEAAQAIRRRIFDPLKDQAIELGLLPEGVDVATADSYLTRVYNLEKIVENRNDFTRRLQDWFAGGLQQSYEGNRVTTVERIKDLTGQISDLRLSPDDRLAVLGQIKDDLLTLAQKDPAITQIAEQYRAQQQALRQATKSGDEAARTAARDALDQLKAQGGGELDLYLKERGRLRGRQDRVNFNYAGLNARVEKALERIADLEEESAKSVERLVGRGRTLERSIRSLDPANAKAEVARLRNAFALEAEKADAALERATKAADRTRDAGDDAAASARLDEEVQRQAARAERLSKIADRLEKAEAKDPAAMLADVRASIKESAEIAAKATMRRGEMAARFRQRIAAMGPEVVDEQIKGLEKRIRSAEAKFYDRWETGAQGKGVDLNTPGGGQFSDEAGRIAQEVVAKLLGGAPGRTSYDVTPNIRGPMRERVLNVPDSLIEDFLESDVERVARVYARTMAADVELSRAFGRPDMADTIGEIQRSYEPLVAKAKDGAEQTRLKKALDRDVRDLEAMRDRIRGTYGVPDNPMGLAVRTARSLRTINYLRMLGGMTLSAIPDVARPIMVHGLGRVMGDGLAPLVRNFRGTRLAAAEVKLAGTALDMVLDSRAQQLADVFEDFGRYSKVERAITYAGEKMGVVSGMSLWNAGMKQMVGLITQTRTLKAITQGASPAEARRLAFLGIDEDMASRIAKQFKAHGDKDGGVWLANTVDWTDFEAAAAYRGALAKEVDLIIATPGQEKPLWMSSELGKTIGQFKTFTFSSMSRVMLNGLQQRDANVLQGFVAAVALGMLAYAVKSKVAGKDVSEDPRKWISEGLDQSGTLGWIFEANNIAEKVTRGRVGLNAAMGLPPSSRYASRNISDTLLGPSVGTVDDAAAIVGATAEGKVSRSDLHKARRLLPFQNLFYLRWLLDHVEDEAGDAMDLPEKPN